MEWNFLLLLFCFFSPALETEKFKSMTLAFDEDLPALLEHNRRYCMVREQACQLTFSSSYKDISQPASRTLRQASSSTDYYPRALPRGLSLLHMNFWEAQSNHGKRIM